MTPAISQRFLPLTGLIALFFAQPSPAAPGDVDASYDAPCKYPAGMAFDGRYLYVADWRDARIHCLDPGSGASIRSFDAPTLKPSGLTCANGLLYVSDDHTGDIHAVNLETGVIDNTFEAPDKRAAGLAWGGGVLYILAKGTIYRVMPEDGTILGYYDAPTPSSKHLAHDGRYLWVSDRIKNELYVVEPEGGKVISLLPAPGEYPSGIAFQGGKLFNADLQDRELHRLIVEDDPMFRLSEPRRARVEYLWAISNYGPGDVVDLTLALALPHKLPNQKLLGDINFSMQPTHMVQDKWGQPVALFEVDRVSAGSKTSVTYNVDARVSAIQYLILPHKVGSLDEIPADIRDQYTADGSRYRMSTPYMQKLVKKIVGDEANPYWIARKIYDHIIDKLEYQMVGGWDVPEVVLKRGTGSCSEYTYTFIALCRAAGVPARYQGSIVVRGDDASIDEAFHRWAQIYLPGYGWVPVDANRGDAKLPADQARGFGGLANRFLITTHGGGDSEYLSWGYNSHATFKRTGYCHVEQETFGFFEPLEKKGKGKGKSRVKAGQNTASNSGECGP